MLIVRRNNINGKALSNDEFIAKENCPELQNTLQEITQMLIELSSDD